MFSRSWRQGLTQQHAQDKQAPKRIPRGLLWVLAAMLLSAHLVTAMMLYKGRCQASAKAPHAQDIVLTEKLIASTRSELARYQAYHGRLPGSLEVLIEEGFVVYAPADAWGKPLQYFLTGEDTYLLFSVGPDGQALSPDDIHTPFELPKDAKP